MSVKPPPIICNSFLTPEVAEVFCADTSTFDFTEIDKGKIICVTMPQKFQTERRYVNTFLKLLFYNHALRRFDKSKAERANDNLLILWADEAQRFMTASEDGTSDYNCVDVIREAGATIVAAAQSTTSLGVVFATGTPIANSMAEMFTMQRYLQSDDLKKHNLHHFDSWAATFGEPVTAMELSPDGAGYRLNTRFARFINVPELMQIFRQTADVQTAQMLNLPCPKLEGEKPAIRNAPASVELKEFVESLAKRAEALKSGRVDPREDNMLKITTEGRKAALDLRLMKPGLPDDPQSKVNLAVENIHRIWEATKEDRLAQLVFCDLSTPQDRGFSVYRDMADKLKRLGFPESEIAFIQDYDADNAKLALFRSVRAGKVRVLFGSTQKMGSGTNVQERLIALHHLDAPWRPADVEQREGRILRQGNRNSSVQIYRYVTEGSFDAYMWQTLETKAKFIAQVMSGDMTVRRLEDMDSAALTYAEVKAIASGNPLVIEKAQVDAELIRLTRLRSAHAEEQYRIRSNLRHSHEEVETWTERLANLRQDLTVRQDTSGDKFRIELDKQVLDNRGIAGELMLRQAEKDQTPFRRGHSHRAVCRV